MEQLKSLLIKDTTREERERIVAESVGSIDGLCDGCSPGLLRMYEDYIEGRRELREINLEFRARYMSGAAGLDKIGCGFTE
ncbi:MAG: purine biosynthesis protein PurH [Oscillospiraceae bacterium]|nr:purine biosynthesis protein PurH [Oscillospiraceae bacterium]